MIPDNFALKAPHDSAIYLPALQKGYFDLVDGKGIENRVLPAGFDPKDFAFWTGNSKIFNHKFCLLSVGGERVGSNFTSSLFDRSTGDFTVVGDSGGFQIGKGTMKGLRGLKKGMSANKAVGAWKYDNNHARQWIIRSLSTYFDYSMTIDMALWIRTNVGVDSPFHSCSEEQLIAMTVDNLNQIEREGLGRTKWLNILQGTVEENITNWWNAVKHFKHGGWALASGAGWRGGLHTMLFTLLTMRDENAFSEGQDWVHVLGVSQPLWHVFFTAFQRELRSVNPKIQFSYDASTPFMMAGMLDKYATPPELNSDIKSWTVSFEQLDAVRKNASSNEQAFKSNTSPLGQMIELQHLVIHKQAYRGRRIDSISNQLMCNHNIWVYLDAGQRADAIAFGGRRHLLPATMRNALEIVEQAFKVDDWRKFIDANKAGLDAVAPSQF